VVVRLTGESVVIQDDGSRPAMPDIRIDYADKPPAYVEVVVDIDPYYAAMDAGITNMPIPIPADLIWHVRVSRHSNLKQLRRELPAVLSRLGSQSGPTAAEQMARLGVTVMGPGIPRPGEEGGIYLIPEGISGSPALVWSALLAWINGFLAGDKTADVRGKLAATGAVERHAFVGLSFISPGDAFFALREEGRPELPVSNPELPTEITHLWISTTTGHGRCLAWFPGAGWLDVADHWATP
jgi:hypothetical protein